MKLTVETARYMEQSVVATMDTDTMLGSILHPTSNGALIWKIRWFLEDGNEVSFAYWHDILAETFDSCLPGSILKKVDDKMTLEYRKYLEGILLE